jgi:hypothetical protein
MGNRVDTSGPLPLHCPASLLNIRGCVRLACRLCMRERACASKAAPAASQAAATYPCICMSISAANGAAAPAVYAASKSQCRMMCKACASCTQAPGKQLLCPYDVTVYAATAVCASVYVVTAAVTLLVAELCSMVKGHAADPAVPSTRTACTPLLSRARAGTLCRSKATRAWAHSVPTPGNKPSQGSSCQASRQQPR